MIRKNKVIVWKYFRIELLLLIFVCYISPIISDMEYSGYEEKNIWHFTASLDFRLIYGTFSFVLDGAYYWLLLKPMIFKKQTVYLILSVFAYIFFYHIFNKYDNWVVSKLDFLTLSLRRRALYDYQHTTFYYIISYALTKLVFTFIGFAFLIRSLQQDEEMNNLKEHQMMTELNYLKAQIQPHFFFNTLNNIYALAIRESRDTAPMIAKLSEMMRYILYETNLPQVPLSQELKFISNYVDIEKLRHPQTVRIDFEVQGSMDNYRVEPLLLLPFIENAFKHGIWDELEQGFVKIIICAGESDLTLQVENSKPLKAALNTNKSGGMGLKNVIKRLEILYFNNYNLQIDDTEKDYFVSLTLPVI